VTAGRLRLAKAAGAAVLACVVAVLPALTSSSEYRLTQYEYILALVILAVSLNTITGFAGQLALGPSAVFAVSGYATAVIANHFPAQVGLVLMCVIGCAAGALTGIVIGLPSLRVGGFYLAMVTLFAALAVPVVAGQMQLTGGPSGISLIANLDFNRYLNGWLLYEVCVGVTIAVTVASAAVLYSRVGRRFATLRTSEELASSVGVSPYRTKLLAFVLGSAFGGLAGSLYVYSQQFMSPDSATTTTSIYVVAACVVGGLGTVMGPVVGGLLVFGLNQFLGGFTKYQGMVFGLLLLLFVIGAPDGIVGTVGRARSRLLPSLAPPVGDAQPASPATVPRVADAARPAESPAAGGGPGEGAGRLVVSGATRAFGQVVAVDSVDLAVRPGTVHGLVGSNGSGKTTTLNLICGYTRLDSGRVELEGTRLDGRPAHEIARYGVARTFQTPKLVEGFTVLENLLPAVDPAAGRMDVASALRLPAGRRWEKAARARAREVLEVTGIPEWEGHLAERLPHGTRRVVEVARALLLRPRFVLLDEPAAGASPHELEMLAGAIRAAAQQGVGVLLVEHNIPFVLDLAEELTVLHQGRRLASGPPSILRDPAIASVFLGEDAGMYPVAES
jgi:ABC-type branched-subunit amino acid transport system ATPase component/ABC-type branched-subunit amino acid transport system permease subunit